MRKKRELERFAKYCFGALGLPPITINYCPAPNLIDPHGNYCFGCYSYDENVKEIYLAYRLPKWALMGVIAHEIWHYRQHKDGRIDVIPLEECEKEADEASKELVAMWLIRGGRVSADDREN